MPYFLFLHIFEMIQIREMPRDKIKNQALDIARPADL